MFLQLSKGELKLVDERAALVEQLQVPCAVCGAHGYIGGEICPLFLDVHPECFPLHEYTTIADRANCRPMSAEERRPVEEAIQQIDEGKDPAFTAFRNISVIVDDAHFRPFCSSNTFPSSISEFCGAPLQLMTITSDANGVGPSTEAVMAAWLRHAIESAGWDRVVAEHSNRNDGYYEHLAQFYNDLYGDTATGDLTASTSTKPSSHL